MEPNEFKATWTRVRIDPGSDMPDDWKKFKGRVKIDPENSDRIVFETEFLAHTGAEISSKIAKHMIQDLKPKIKKVIISVSQPSELDAEDRAQVRFHRNRKKADAWLRNLQKETGKKQSNFTFEWKAPDEILSSWDDDMDGKRLFEISHSLEETYGETLQELVREEFYKQKIVDKLDIVCLRGETDSGYEYFLLKLCDKNESKEERSETISKFVEENSLNEFGTVNTKSFLWKDADPELVYDIFVNHYMNIVDTEDNSEIFDNWDNINEQLREAFIKNGGKVQKKMDIEGNEKTQVRATMDRKERVFDQSKAVGNAILAGAGLAVADQTGELLLDLASKMAKDLPFLTPMLESPEGREFIKFTLALILHTLAHQTDLLPKSDLISKATEKQMELSSYKVIAPQLGVLRKFAMDFAEKDEMAELKNVGNKLANTMEKPVAGETIEVLVEDVGEGDYVGA